MPPQAAVANPAVTIDEASETDVEAITAVQAILRTYNEEHAGPRNFEALYLYAREADGQVVGGLIGETGRDWCYIDTLAIAPVLRGQDLGRKLLAKAETIARARGCIGVFLNSFSFQAPEFYKRQGYTEFGRMDDFPRGHQNIWLLKRL